MKLGYPVINLGLGVTSSHTFRLALLSEEKLFNIVRKNLDALEETVRWNIEHNLLFYRISSNLIPFASHLNMDIAWQTKFAPDLARIGQYIKDNHMRISMHPGQFVVINSPNGSVYANSVRELQYHADILDLLQLDSTHKIQFHLGGLHGDAEGSREVFIQRYNALSDAIRSRLVIENDERFASVQECFELSKRCGIPVLFDTLHHEVKNDGETILAGLKKAMSTWGETNGIPMIDYSNQNPYKRVGAHAETIDVEKFRSFVRSLKGKDIDIMFEIKNKEASALQAQIVLEGVRKIF